MALSAITSAIPGGDVGQAVAGAGATAATAIFVAQMLKSVGQTMEGWKKIYSPHMMEEMNTITEAYGRLVTNGLEGSSQQKHFFGLEPVLDGDGEVMGMAPTWQPVVGTIPWDHARWIKLISSNGAWYSRIATLLHRICQWQYCRMTAGSLDMFRFTKKKRVNDPLNLLCEEIKTWLVTMHSKGELQLIRHLEHRIQFFLHLRVAPSSIKTNENANSIISSRSEELVFDHPTAQLLIELEYRLHNFLADVYHKVNRAGISVCLELLTVRFRITYEQLVYYLFYILNAEPHGLAPSDMVNNVTRLKNPKDSVQGRPTFDMTLLKNFKDVKGCMDAKKCSCISVTDRITCKAFRNQRVRLISHLVKLQPCEVLGVPPPTVKPGSKVYSKVTAPSVATEAEKEAAKQKFKDDNFLLGTEVVIPKPLAIDGRGDLIGKYFMAYEPDPHEKKSYEEKMKEGIANLANLLNSDVRENTTGLPRTLLLKLQWQLFPKSSRSYAPPPNSLPQTCMNLLSQPLQPIDYHLMLQRYLEALGFVLLLRRASIILDGMNSVSKEDVYSLMNDQFVQFLHCAKKACTHLLSTCDQLQLDIARMFGEVFSNRACNDQLWRSEFENWKNNWRHANSLWSSQAPNRADPVNAADLQSGVMAGKNPEETSSIESGDGIAENLRVMITQLDAVAQFAAKDQAEELALHNKRAALTAENLKAMTKSIKEHVLPGSNFTTAPVVATPPRPVIGVRELLVSYGRGGSMPLKFLSVRPAFLGVKIKPRQFTILNPATDAQAIQMRLSTNKYFSTPDWIEEQQALTAAGNFYLLITDSSKSDSFIVLTKGSRSISWSVCWEGTVKPKMLAAGGTGLQADSVAGSTTASSTTTTGNVTSTSPKAAVSPRHASPLVGSWPPQLIKGLDESTKKSGGIAASDVLSYRFSITYKYADPHCVAKNDQTGIWYLAAYESESYDNFKRVLDHLAGGRSGGPVDPTQPNETDGETSFEPENTDD